MNVHVSPSTAITAPPASAAETIADLERQIDALGEQASNADLVERMWRLPIRSAADAQCKARVFLKHAAAAPGLACADLDADWDLDLAGRLLRQIAGIEGDAPVNMRLINLMIDQNMAEPAGHSDFNVFLEASLATLPLDAAVLIPLYQSYRAMAEAALAVLRVNGIGSTLVENEITRANNYACAIAVKLSQLSSVPADWAEKYLETMVSHHFFTGDQPRELKKVIAKATALAAVA